VNEDINRTPKNWKEQDKEDPGQFIGRFFLYVQDVKTNQNTKPFQKKIQITKSPVCSGNKKKNKGQLHK